VPSRQSHTEAWLHELPGRWARNAAIGGGALATLSALPMLAKGGGGFVFYMIGGLFAVVLALTVMGYLCGRWARFSLAGPFDDPTTAEPFKETLF